MRDSQRLRRKKGQRRQNSALKVSRHQASNFVGVLEEYTTRVGRKRKSSFFSLIQPVLARNQIIVQILLFPPLSFWCRWARNPWTGKGHFIFKVSISDSDSFWMTFGVEVESIIVKLRKGTEDFRSILHTHAHVWLSFLSAKEKVVKMSRVTKSDAVLD